MDFYKASELPVALSGEYTITSTVVGLSIRNSCGSSRHALIGAYWPDNMRFSSSLSTHTQTQAIRFVSHALAVCATKS